MRQTEIRHGLVDHFLRQRDVTIFHYDLLASLRQDQLDELGVQRGQRLVRGLVDVNVEEARQRVGAVQGVAFVVFNELAAFFLGQGYSLDAGGFVADARVTDAVQRAADRLHDRSRAWLFVDVRLEVAFAQGFFLEVAVGAGHRVTTEQLNRLVGQVAGHTQVTPGFDIVLATAQASRREDRIDLSHSQTLDRVVLVHEDRQGINSNRDCGWLVAILLLERLQLDVLHLAAHRAQVSGAFSQCRRCGGGTGSLNLNVHVRVFFFVGFSPQGHQVGQGIGTDAGEVARHACGFDVSRNSRVNSGNRISGGNASGGKRQGRHQTLQFHALLLAGIGVEMNRAPVSAGHMTTL